MIRKLFRRRTVEERMTMVLLRAMEREFPQQWTSLSEARKPCVPRDFQVTNWEMTRSVGLYGNPRLTVTLEARGWAS